MTAPMFPGFPAATVEDLLALPEEGRRHELVEGIIVQKGAASGEHGLTQFRLATYLALFTRRFRRHVLGGWWFATEVDIYFDATNTLRPDVVGWRRDRVASAPSGIPVKERPDWVCEILSTNKGNDLIKKKRVYHRHEVPHYWIVDPAAETLTVYRWTPDAYEEVLVGKRGETIAVEPFSAMPLSVNSIFSDEEDDPPAP